MSLYAFVLVTLGLYAVTSTTAPLITTTEPRVTTTPRLITNPAGSCEYEGKIYMSGQNIDTRCEILRCDGGAVINYGKVNCDFDYHPYLCNGVLYEIPGECCAFCNETTAVPLTTPPPLTTTMPSDMCVEGGKFFMDGEEISRSTDGCTGTTCQSGQIIHWDDPCVIDPPFCPGAEEKLPDQCCPICHVTNSPEPITLLKTTTQQPELTFPAGNCVIDGAQHANGDTIRETLCVACRCLNGRSVCQSKTRCPILKNCPVSMKTYVAGQCCPICDAASMGVSVVALMLLFLFQTVARKLCV